MTAPATYFPVEAGPLRMAPRLRPFGTDFGNGTSDHRYFQRDREFDDYRAAKRDRGAGSAESPLGLRCDGPAESHAHEAALSWAEDTLASEQPGTPATAAEALNFPARWERLALAVQEDLVLVHRGADSIDRVLACHVCFPSAWRPETILGRDFRAIHAPVPDFTDREETARAMVRAMIDRGPYVRFVWTVSADDHLDHHPDHGHHRAWKPGAQRGWLRVERQVTVPLPRVSGAVFLIRTYRTRFAALETRQRQALTLAIEQLPEAVRLYKNVDREAVLSALRQDRGD